MVVVFQPLTQWKSEIIYVYLRKLTAVNTSQFVHECGENQQTALGTGGMGEAIEIITSVRRAQHTRAVRCLFSMSSVTELKAAIRDDPDLQVAGVDWHILNKVWLFIFSF